MKALTFCFCVFLLTNLCNGETFDFSGNEDHLEGEKISVVNGQKTTSKVSLDGDQVAEVIENVETLFTLPKYERVLNRDIFGLGANALVMKDDSIWGYRFVPLCLDQEEEPDDITVSSQNIEEFTDAINNIMELLI
ncbi:hypothetical protein BB560_002834 [Smittium megazygosporum]|uniref:Uncharacterized protein n=1 Tax=Smittium megazygosporum TaxID=133381 RepID=A0A2T9ZDP3_9FUNG|nr:hypothetical protein BB560_002834 [Smittium megazygosporum]